MSDRPNEQMRLNLIELAKGVLDLVDEDGGHGENVEDLIAAASAGDELATAVLAYCLPQVRTFTPAWSDHVHTWTKVSEQVTGMTHTRTYECLVCNSHTTLVGPYGATSPFDVEEGQHDDSQATR